MSETALLPLSEWENFYVIVGSSAAALTGLQFVVIALGSDVLQTSDAEATTAFGTPTVIHFCAVLLIAAILSTPRHTPTSLALCLVICGLAGLAVIASVLKKTRRVKSYQPVLEDWIWHTILPALSYAALVVAGAITFRHVVPALFIVASADILLLYIGIHNAWDAAVWLATRRSEDKPSKEG